MPDIKYPYKDFPEHNILFSFRRIPVIENEFCCPKCMNKLILKKNQFYFRDTRSVNFSGLVCESCNSLWENPNESWSVEITGIPETLLSLLKT